MATQKVPSLDGTGRIRDKHLPTRLGAGELSATYGPAAQAASAPMKSAFGQGLYAVSGNDLAGAVAAIVAAGSGVLYVPEGQTVTASTVTALPDQVSAVRIDGEIVCAANVSVFTRDGSAVGSSVNITAPIIAGQRTVSAVPTGLAVNDWVFVVSADTLPGTTDKLGYMRMIKSMTGSTVTFDSPIPRDMPSTTRRMRKIQLAKPIEIYGRGTIRYSSPATCFSSMLDFTFVNGVTVRGVTLRDGGHHAIRICHVVGWTVDCDIDNFIDDVAGGHVGYGVNCEGGSRDGVMRGHASRCRHAFTTNVGKDHPQFSFYGEPENARAEPVTTQCTDKALDTHRAGWGIALIVNDKGSGGGVQVRSDATYVEGIVEGNYIGHGLTVRANIIVPPTIGPMKIMNHGGGGVSMDSDVNFKAFPDFHNLTGPIWTITNNAVIRVSAETSIHKVTSNVVVNNSTTPAPATGLSFEAKAGAVYEVEGSIDYAASQAADVSFSWTAPSGSTFDWCPNALSTGSTSSGGTIIRQNKALADTAPVGGIGTATKVMAYPKGLLTVGATGGPVALNFAQVVAEASDATVYAGSYLKVTRVA